MACAWWRRQIETFSASLAICAGNSPVTDARPVTRSFDIFFDLRLNKRLSKQRWGWWFETPSRPLWRHCNVTVVTGAIILAPYHSVKLFSLCEDRESTDDAWSSNELLWIEGIWILVPIMDKGDMVTLFIRNMIARSTSLVLCKGNPIFRQNGCHFADDIYVFIFLYEKCCIWFFALFSHECNQP